MPLFAFGDIALRAPQLERERALREAALRARFSELPEKNAILAGVDAGSHLKSIFLRAFES